MKKRSISGEPFLSILYTHSGTANTRFHCQQSSNDGRLRTACKVGVEIGCNKKNSQSRI